MDWCCTRCGHRQDAEAACGACGQSSVHDLRSSRTRDLIDGIELRRREAKDARAKQLAAGIGGGAWILAMATGMGWLVAIVVAIAVGVAVFPIFDRTPFRQRFPYLPQLPPTDRP